MIRAEGGGERARWLETGRLQVVHDVRQLENFTAWPGSHFRRRGLSAREMPRSTGAGTMFDPIR